MHLQSLYVPVFVFGDYLPGHNKVNYQNKRMRSKIIIKVLQDILYTKE